MARPKKKADDATAPVPVRFSQKMRADFKRLSEKKEIAQQDLIRLAAEVGLKVLAKTDFDVAEAVARYAFQLSAEDREDVERLHAATDVNVIEEPEHLIHPGVALKIQAVAVPQSVEPKRIPEGGRNIHPSVLKERQGSGG